MSRLTIPTLEQARHMWHNDLVSDAVVQHNMQAWRQARQQLGERWLLAKPVPRLRNDQAERLQGARLLDAWLASRRGAA